MLGLNRLTGLDGPFFSLSAKGALADVVLWAIIRLQTRVFATTLFAQWVLCSPHAGLKLSQCLLAHVMPPSHAALLAQPKQRL